MAQKKFSILKTILALGAAYVLGAVAQNYVHPSIDNLIFGKPKPAYFFFSVTNMHENDKNSDFPMIEMYMSRDKRGQIYWGSHSIMINDNKTAVNPGTRRTFRKKSLDEELSKELGIPVHFEFDYQDLRKVDWNYGTAGL